MQPARLLFLILGVCALIFFAQRAAAEDVLHVIQENEALRDGPAGALAGTLRTATPLKQLESRGGWVRVQVEGWVKESALTSAQSATGAPARTEAASPLELVDFELRSMSKRETGDQPRVHLRLKIKNKGTNPAAQWSAVLTAQDKAGTTFFTTPIRNGEQAIPANGVGELNYYWTEKEDGYRKLQGLTKETVKFSIGLVKVQ